MEMQIETTMRHHFIPIRMGIIKKQKKTSIGEDVEKLESLYTVIGNVNWCNHCVKQYGAFSKN